MPHVVSSESDSMPPLMGSALHLYTQGQGSSDAYQDKYRRYFTPTGWVTMLAKEELLLPDPKPLDPGVPEPDMIEGLSLRMTQAMNHYQCEECHCFVCGATDPFTWDCLH